MNYNPRYRRKIRGKYRPFLPTSDPVKYMRRQTRIVDALIQSGRYIEDSNYATFSIFHEVKAISAELKRNPHKYER